MTNCHIKRRTFLKITAGSFFAANLTACTHKKFYNPDEDIILSGGSYKDNNKTQSALVAVNLTQQEKRVIDSPFLPHDILVDPNNKYRIYCFEKNGINACEIDLKKQSVIRTFKSTGDKHFSGHAAFSDDGKNLYCIENTIDANPKKQFGKIVIRNSETLAVSKQIPTHGLSAHDCQMLKNQILVVSNTGRSDSKNIRPGIIHIGLNSGRVLSYLHATDNNQQNNINNGHFEINDTNDIVIASASTATAAPMPHHKGKLSKNKQLGGVSIKNHNNQLITMNEPKPVIKRMTGEALSIEISDKARVAAITHPEADLLTFWSIKDRQLLKAFGMLKPRGICQTINGESFIVSYGNKAAMAQIATKDLMPIASSIVQPTFATGEHIMNWSLELRKIMPKNLY